MSSEFDGDLESLRQQLSESREHFLSTLGQISDDQLDVARRGGWSIRRVLEHVIVSEEGYARVVGHLNGTPIASPAPESLPGSVQDANAKLASSRTTLLDALDGVDEDAFYALRQLGKDEYSIVSVLENVVSHDHEHGVQLEQILRTA